MRQALEDWALTANVRMNNPVFSEVTVSDIIDSYEGKRAIEDTVEQLYQMRGESPIDPVEEYNH